MSVMQDAELIADGIEKSRGLADKFASLTREHFGSRLVRMILYGSVARGDWTPESDIDVLVTLDAVSDSDGEWLAAKAFSLGVIETGIVLQPVFMSEDMFVEMKTRELRFAMDVSNEGIAL